MNSCLVAAAVFMLGCTARAQATELVFNKSQTTCLNCTAGFEVISEVLRCNNNTDGEWACTGMPYMHNISILCMDEPSFACDQDACIYTPITRNMTDSVTSASETACKMMYYMKEAQRVRMQDVSILTLDASKYATGRRQLPKAQILNIGEGGAAISKIECVKEGVTDMGSPRWKCNDLETRRLGGPPITTFRMRCEAYDAQTILAGSCRLEYTAKRYSIRYFLLDVMYCTFLIMTFLVVVVVAWFTETGSILMLNTQSLSLPSTRYSRPGYHMD